MLVRIIYRPSYPRMTVRHSAVDGAGAPFQPRTADGAAESVAKTGSRSHRKVIRALALLLVRLGFGAMVMAAWRIAADLGLPIPFAIKSGVLIHWQVWFGGGVLLVAGAGLLARRLRFGRERDDAGSGQAEEAA